MGEKISLCMIVRDEEQVLARCLEGAGRFADQIVVVDTGSVDSSREIAASFGCEVHEFEWTDDFSEARNHAFSLARNDYIMWLDADDVVSAGEAQKILRLARDMPSDAACAFMRYHLYEEGENEPVLVYQRERLFRKSAGPRWHGAVHEVCLFSGSSVETDIVIEHRRPEGRRDPARNLRIYEKMLSSGAPFSPRDMFYHSRELMYNMRTSEAVEGFRRFLEQPGAWVENRVTASIDLSECLSALGRTQEALDALYSVAGFSDPRAEVCCALGKRFYLSGDFTTAAAWYSAALLCPPQTGSGAFCDPDCYGYLPCIQLCVCYWQLGRMDLSAIYNERAGAFKPDDAFFLENREFFSRTPL